MADRKRNLNIPMYDVKDAPGGAVSDDEDVIDVETSDLDPTLAERLQAFAKGGAESVAEAVRNVKLNGAKDAFFTQRVDDARARRGSDDPRVRARQAGRERRSAQAQIRDARRAEDQRRAKERVDLERQARMDPLARLKLDTAKSGEAYLVSLRKSGILGHDQSPQSQRKQLSGMHQIYASMMVLQCVRPLQQGLSAQNVVTTLGMAASMWAMSPDFRNQVGGFVEGIGDAIKAKINARGEKKDAKAQNKLDKLVQAGKGDQLADRWRRRLDKIEFAERGHRLPFTAQSAAMTEVGLAEAAYAEMRSPGANPDLVRQRYDSALSALYDFVQADGVDREEVSRSMRVIVGQRIEHDPALASVFDELGHGFFAKSEPREVFVNGSTEKITVWTGDFVDSHKDKTISAGSFRLRSPKTMDEHRVLSAETLSAELSKANTAAEMNDALSQFVVAAAVSEYPDAVGQVEDPAARRRLGKVRTMFTSMNDDGLSADEQSFAYTAAFVDAVEAVQFFRPELSAEWVSKYGENWREKVAEDIRRFKETGVQAEREKDTDARSEHFSAKPSEPAPSASAEDIIDAEIVFDDPTTDARTERPRGGEPRSERRPNRRPASLDEPVYEGELIEDESNADEPILELDTEDLGVLDPASARAAILAGTTPTAKDDPGKSIARRTAAKVNRARVNQHYNEVDTGSLTGIGSDDAKPLQDVDFQLG